MATLPELLKTTVEMEGSDLHISTNTPPQVRVVDRFGNPVPNIVVSWDVLTGEGEVPSATTATDSLGLASTEWDLGNERGVHKLTATIDGVPGSPVTFTAYVLF